MEEQVTVLPDGGTPDQCYTCERRNEANEVWTTDVVDADPGDPGVGPRPAPSEVAFCPSCAAARVARAAQMEAEWAGVCDRERAAWDASGIDFVHETALQLDGPWKRQKATGK